MWFQKVFGFREKKRYADVRKQFRVETRPNQDVILHTQNSSKSFFVGKFETPTVQELKEQLRVLQGGNGEGANNNNNNQNDPSKPAPSRLTFHHLAGNVGDLHQQNPDAVFQAASQFNCLEMVDSHVTPDAGITGYVYDRTQGPVCAMACPAGTLFRNYFVNEHGQGGTEGQQINCLRDIEQLVDNDTHRYWHVQNGYALPTTNTSMAQLSSKLLDGSTIDSSSLRDALRVGVHWSTGVVDGSDGTVHNVSQVYVSAVPIGYHSTSLKDWEPFATLILDGLYEATLLVGAIRARLLQKRVTVFLTMAGGGVFANPQDWIVAAIAKALDKYRDENLEVILVHYNYIDEDFEDALPETVSTLQAPNEEL